ncbi:hypothetical protein [Denitratisoma sp. DHT3]|uniref:hypothetical protein n=1 Tax=Denitratisoma sp. DHT3 TaxID=1981880 RepID=UPI0016489737|nr:hypothetical protein [Denitratisoma sp. DHT3]
MSKIYYRDGEKPIPRSIWLACLGREAVRPKGRELGRDLPHQSFLARLAWACKQHDRCVLQGAHNARLDPAWVRKCHVHALTVS